MRQSSEKKALAKYTLLKVLRNLKPEIRVQLIQFLNDDAINILSEALYNVLFVDIGLSPENKKKLKEEYSKWEKILRRASKKSNNIKTRKKLLVQNGAGLGAILGLAASILSNLILGHKWKDEDQLWKTLFNSASNILQDVANDEWNW